MSDICDHRDVLLDIDSNIPVGKGLSSSTADMVASIRALENALGIALKRDYIGQRITEIDPNDGLHYENSCAYHHTTGKLIRQYDFVPPLHILGIDLGGHVDTVGFNNTSMHWTDGEMDAYAAMLEEATAAFAAEDTEALCALATRSTQAWQQRMPKRELPLVMDLCADTGALGVINTHSGTFLGLAYPAPTENLGGILQTVERALPDKNLQWFQTISCEEHR